MSSTPLQTIINPSTDPSLSVYATNEQTVPPIAQATVLITNTEEYVTEIFDFKTEAAGTDTEVQYNNGNGLAGDASFTYNDSSKTLNIGNSINVGNSIVVGTLLTDNIVHANGLPYNFAPNYSNSNVQSYMPTYTGNLTGGNISIVDNVYAGGNISGFEFIGSGAGLTNIPAANISGTVANASHALVADNANSIPGANVSGYVSGANYSNSAGNANHANVADVANSVSAGNITGTISFATTASTVTTQAQPNITSTGTLSGVTVSGVGNINTITSVNGGSSSTAAVTISTNNGNGGTGYAGLIKLNNSSGGTANPNKHIRMDTNGNLQVVNSSYNSTIFDLNDSGNLSALNKVSANYFVGDGSGLTNLPGVSNISNISNGSSNIKVNNNDSIFVNTNGNLAATFTSSPNSTSYNSGALVLNGGLGANGNIHASNNIVATNTVFAGYLSDFSSYTAPSFVGKNAGSEYIQGALVNSNGNGSADWIAYPDNYPGPSDDHGWMDMGFTGSTFNPNVSGVDLFSITKPNDGYIFASGVDGAGFGGNLIIATDTTGPNNDIIFAVNGFTQNNEVMRLDAVNKKFYVGRTVTSGTNAIDLVVTGNILPNANVTYNLGSPTQQFKSLYISGSTIYLGGTTISASSNGQVTIGNATFASNGTIAANSVSGLGNISLLNISGNSSQVLYGNGVFAPLSTSYGDSNVSTLLSGGGFSANVNITGNVIGNNFVSGGNLTSTNIIASGNSNVAGNLKVSGTTNLGLVSNVTITGGASGQVLTTNGSGGLSWATVSGGGSYSNTNVSSYLSAFTGNIAAGNINGGNLVTANFFAGTVTTAAQPNITSTGTLVSLTVTANTTSGNLTTGGYITAGAGNIGGSLLVGNAITVSGNATISGLTSLGPVGNVSITGGSNGQILTTNGSGSLSWSTPASPVYNLVTANVTATAYGNYQMIQGSTANTTVTLPDANGLAAGAWVVVRPYDVSSGSFQAFIVKNGANSQGIQGSSTSPSTISGNRALTAVWNGGNASTGFWYYSNQ